MTDRDSPVWRERARALARLRSTLGLDQSVKRLLDDLDYAVLVLDTEGQVVAQNAYALRALDGKMPSAPLAVSDPDELGSVVVWSELDDGSGELMEDAEALMAMLTHDMGAPLRAIAQIAGWLIEDAESAGLDAQTLDHLTLISTRVDRLQRMQQDLLAYVRAGYAPDAWEDVDIVELCHDVVRALDPTASFEVRVLGSPLVTQTAAVPLYHVIHNLASNAIRYHDVGRGVIDVRIEEVDPMRLRVRVADDGPGIELRHRDRAMELMATLRSRDRGAGSGVGLALVRKLVTEFGGVITLESNQPRGLACVFTWPHAACNDG